MSRARRGVLCLSCDLIVISTSNKHDNEGLFICKSCKSLEMETWAVISSHSKAPVKRRKISQNSRIHCKKSSSVGQNDWETAAWSSNQYNDTNKSCISVEPRGVPTIQDYEVLASPNIAKVNVDFMKRMQRESSLILPDYFCLDSSKMRGGRKTSSPRRLNA